MRECTHTVDFCVVGGGMAGLLAALAAARRGVQVALVQDRPVLGGNASSEIRMHICGAHGENLRETGILEELLLENHHRNPNPCYPLWDSVLYGAARYQENLALFLNCSVNRCTMAGERIQSVTGWQLTTETWHTIEATLFADCSGDGILAPLSGAEFRIGREGREEYGESIAPPESDCKTMGMSCLLQAREFETAQPFTPPAWAHRYEDEAALNNRQIDLRRTNYWWIEVGGEQDSIHDTESLRDELQRIAFGVWDYLKNRSSLRDEVACWGLDWIGFLPGKRESRRYLGDHVLTQNDVEAEGRFADLVAYGGWSMDDHFPGGFYHPGAGTIFHPAPSPFGIPYRSLYSRNIENLFCAGRNHSATHAAMSATRVMGTTAMMGQAVGTAAALALRHSLTPRGVYEQQCTALQQLLLEDDCYLPWQVRAVSLGAAGARLTADQGDPEPLRNGVDRPVGDGANSWVGPCGAAVEYRFGDTQALSEARLVCDSDLNRSWKNMPCLYPRTGAVRPLPQSLLRSFRIEADRGDGVWQTVARVDENIQRLVRLPLECEAAAVRLVPEATWGAEAVQLFGFEVR